VAVEVAVALRTLMLVAASQTRTALDSQQLWLLDSLLSVRIVSVWRAAGLTSLAWVGISVAAQGSQAALIVNPSNAPMVALQTRTVPDSTLCAILRWTTIASIVTTTIVQQAA